MSRRPEASPVVKIREVKTGWFMAGPTRCSPRLSPRRFRCLGRPKFLLTCLVFAGCPKRYEDEDTQREANNRAKQGEHQRLHGGSFPSCVVRSLSE